MLSLLPGTGCHACVKDTYLAPQGKPRGGRRGGADRQDGGQGQGCAVSFYADALSSAAAADPCNDAPISILSSSRAIMHQHDT